MIHGEPKRSQRKKLPARARTRHVDRQRLKSQNTQSDVRISGRPSRLEVFRFKSNDGRQSWRTTQPEIIPVKTLISFSSVLAALTGVAILSSITPSTVSAQTACYVPGSGTMYRIKEPKTPAQIGRAHV